MNNKDFKNITIVGSGYVGMSLAVLLAQTNKVTVLDIDEDRIKKINQRNSTVEDDYINEYLKKDNVRLIATSDLNDAYLGTDLIIIATPTNYDPVKNYFDTSSIDLVIKDIFSINKSALVVIKSTIPIGYTEDLQTKFCSENILFSPEFLREGKALYDNLYPSRIIIGSKLPIANKFANLLAESALKESVDVLLMEPKEAEAIKLFSNTYLAMRIAFFNELDTFSLKNNLNSKSIIDGMSYDDRIGHGYNNPSFGYGGYCLPKDTKQLVANYENVPERLISAIVESNKIRKEFIAEYILDKKLKNIGIYRLVMKEGSDNFRESAVQDIIKNIKKNINMSIKIYEPLFTGKNFEGCNVEKDLETFKSTSDIIIANRLSEEINDVMFKTFSRDIFNVD
tara:strand:+ start:1282 stop:2469 length:1188 start_codon:yes stop_codon:yes gene_type:complete